MPKTDTELFDRLTELRIDHKTTEHPPLYTVEDSKALRGQLDGAHIKNLFLRDRKKRIWLCTVLEDRDVDLKSLRTRLGAKGSLSFGSPDLLMEVLGVIPGAVTPFGVFNDTERRVSVVLDSGILDHDLVNCHPLRNDRTTTLSADGLMAFLSAEGYAPEIIDFGIPLGAPE